MQAAQVEAEKRIETSQVKAEERIVTSQKSLKSDLQAAQVEAEKRMQSNSQLILSSVTYKALFVGLGAAVAGFTLFEGMLRVLGYEITPKKSG